MNYPSRMRQHKERQIMEQNVGYAQGAVKQYLNIKRSSKNKCCLALFFIYFTLFGIYAGFGFFFGNFTKIGTFILIQVPFQQQALSALSLFHVPIQQVDSASTNSYACDLVGCTPPTNYGYLQKVCVDSSYSVSNSQLAQQISIFSFDKTLDLMSYMNVGIISGFVILFSLLICFQKLIYFYILLTFGFLLGFAFYLLKTIDDRITSLTTQYATDTSLPNSQLISDEQTMQPLAYILLASYLILFPVVLFSPSKIRIGIQILSKMYNYFQSNYTVIILSLATSFIVYGMVFIIAFLLVNFATGGTSTTTNDSFFYSYNSVNLDHTAGLIFFFFGVYWMFGVISSFHQYIIASSVMQWYFQDGGKLKPVKKGIKRGWYNMGSQAMDAVLMPLQWVNLLVYSICKMDSQTVQQYQNQHNEDCQCFSSCLFKFRQLMTKLYIKINRGSPMAATLTNNSFIQSCQLAAVTFSDRKHRFFNIGGIITLFLSLFVTLSILFINYIVLYYQNYDVFPARVSSLQLQVVLAIFLGLAVGQILGNLFGTSIDTLLFCFLKQKSGGQSISQRQIKKYLQQLYTAEEEQQTVQQMYQIESDAQE